MEVAQAWKGGQAGEDNGLLFVLAVDDRRMRLDVGYGLEEHLPDDAVRRLLDAQLPLMREQDYAGALVHIIQGVRERLPGGASTASPSDVAAAPGASPWDDSQRLQAFHLLLYVAALLFVWFCFAWHPGMRRWWGERTPLVLSWGVRSWLWATPATPHGEWARRPRSSCSRSVWSAGRSSLAGTCCSKGDTPAWASR